MFSSGTSTSGTPQYLPEIGGERGWVAEVGRSHRDAPSNSSHPCLDRSVGGSPAEHQHLGVIVAVDLDRRDVVGNRCDLPGTDVGHRLVVGRVVRDVAGHLLLPARPAGARDRGCRGWPTAGQRSRGRAGRGGSARCSAELVAKGTEMSGRSDTSGSRQGSDPLAMWLSESSITGVMYFTASRTASRVVETRRTGVATATGSGDSPCLPYIAREIGRRALLHPRGRSCPLHIDNDHGQLERHGERGPFALQRQARAAGSHRRQIADEGSTDGGPDGGDLVFDLEGAHPSSCASTARGGCRKPG